MAWSSILSNQLVSRSDLQNAVSTGVFTLKSGQTIPTTTANKIVSTTEAQTWCNLTATDPNGLGRLPQKSWFIPTTLSKAWSAFKCPYIIQYQCDFNDFADTVYSLNNPPFGSSNILYVDSALTTPLSSPNNSAYVDYGDSNFYGFWRASTNQWYDQRLRKTGQTASGTLTISLPNVWSINIGTVTYKKLGQSWNVSATMTNGTGITPGAKWRQVVTVGGASTGGTYQYTGPWITATIGSSSSGSFTVTCESQLYLIEMDSSTVTNGSTYTFSVTMS